MLTGLDDETLSTAALREGAQDYLVKGQADTDLLVRSMRYAIERKRAEEKERLRSQELEALFKVASILVKTPRIARTAEVLRLRSQELEALFKVAEAFKKRLLECLNRWPR